VLRLYSLRRGRAFPPRPDVDGWRRRPRRCWLRLCAPAPAVDACVAACAADGPHRGCDGRHASGPDARATARRCADRAAEHTSHPTAHEPATRSSPAELRSKPLQLPRSHRGDSIAAILKNTAATAGLDATNIAGHSVRAGMATHAGLNGSSERSIAKTTRHRSRRVSRRYICPSELFRENASLGLCADSLVLGNLLSAEVTTFLNSSTGCPNQTAEPSYHRTQTQPEESSPLRRANSPGFGPIWRLGAQP